MKKTSAGMGGLQRTPVNYGEKNIKPEKSPLSTPARETRARERASSREYRHNKHSVGSARVHLVWIPKRRKPVLIGDVKLRLSEILTEVASEKGWIIEALQIAPNHVHVLVEHDPKTPINSIVKAFKGRSSRYLRQEFPHLLKLPTLWTHSYFYDTTVKVSTAKIQEYINDPHHS